MTTSYVGIPVEIKSLLLNAGNVAETDTQTEKSRNMTLSGARTAAFQINATGVLNYLNIRENVSLIGKLAIEIYVTWSETVKICFKTGDHWGI